MPDAGAYLWEWYYDLSNKLVRVRDGVPQPIPPSEFMAWREATGHVVYSREYAILSAMDAAYCAELAKELADYRAREEERRRSRNPSQIRG